MCGGSNTAVADSLHAFLPPTPGIPPILAVSACYGPLKPLDDVWDHQQMRLPHLPAWAKADIDVPIDRSLLSVDQEARIRELLSFDNPEFYKVLNSGQDVTGIPKRIRAYEKYRRMYRLPRHTPFRKLGLREPRPEFPPTQSLPWEFTGTFRDNQQDAFAALRHQLIYRKDGVLVLSCGKGKTVLATAAFGWQQRPALAVVTQLFIAQQWKDALLQFTNISEDRIGLIGDGHNEWDRDFVISTVQSLAKKDDLPPEFYRRFGVVFFDEVHRLGAPLFSRVVSVFSGIRIGLTATLERPDGMHELFMLHVGKPFYEDKQQQLIPRVYFLSTPVEKDASGFRQWGRRGRVNIAKLITHLSRLDYRREFVVQQIQRAHRKGRKVLVLSERVDELVAHQQVLGEHAGICVGTLNKRTMTQPQRRAALTRPVVLATAQLVKEGLDQPDIDTLICEYPQSSEAFTEQSAGRILRLQDGKRAPVIVILVDSGVYVKEGGGEKYYPFVVKAEKMEQTFRQLGYDIVKRVS